jgi:hypothetical protein
MIRGHPSLTIPLKVFASHEYLPALFQLPRGGAISFLRLPPSRPRRALASTRVYWSKTFRRRFLWENFYGTTAVDRG